MDGGGSGNPEAGTGNPDAGDDASAPDAKPPAICTDHSDCGPEQPVCGQDKFCTFCDRDDQCALHTNAPACVAGSCVECSADNTTACTADKPVCDVSEGACVQCTGADQSVCAGQGRVCLRDGHDCVGCNDDDDCRTAENSRCDPDTHECTPCDDDSQCSDVPGKPVCLAGTCVACTREKAQVCNVAGTQYVCDPQTHSCDLQRKARGKTLCNVCTDPDDTDCKARPDCISNDECQANQACVEVPAGGGLKVCQHIRDDSPCPRPYIGETMNPVPSADGPSVKVCTFRLGTTCQAHSHYSNKRCGTPKPGNPDEDQPNSGDDSKCGIGNGDGHCVLFNTQNQYLCTVPCNNNVSDCPSGASACNNAVSPNLCTL